MIISQIDGSCCGAASTAGQATVSLSLTRLPSRIARIFCELPLDRPLKRVGLPFEVPDFEVALYWHSRSERSTALSWFFEQIVAALVEADQK